jgi:L-alanine-DL-glutamate epimerase-like enolase superfamily enzyme
MIIKSITIYKCSVDIGFKYSTWTTDKSSAILIKIKTDDGLTGWGEYGVNKWNTKKILYSTCRQLIGADVEKIINSLIVKPIFHIKQIDEFIVGFDRRRRLVREGFSIALYDLLGKYKKKPIYELFNLKNIRREMHVMPVIHVLSKEDRLKVLKIWEGLGVKYFKIKLTGVLHKDIEHLDYLLKNMKNSSKIIIVDANYGYVKANDVVRLSEFTYANNIDYIQNPMKMNIFRTSRLMSKCLTKFTADNTPWWPNSKRVIDGKSCVLINHHPNIQGGLDWLIRTAQYAKLNGIKNIIGSSGTFGIQNSAFQSMAAITGLLYPCEEITLEPYMKYCSEFYSFNDNPNVIKNMNTFKNGKIYLTNNHGLGVEVDEDKIKKFEIYSRVFND